MRAAYDSENIRYYVDRHDIIPARLLIEKLKAIKLATKTAILAADYARNFKQDNRRGKTFELSKVLVGHHTLSA